MESAEYKTTVTKASLLLKHVCVNMLSVGDGIAERLALCDKARAELHI